AAIGATSATKTNSAENNVGAAHAGNVADPVVPPPAEAPVRAVPGETSVEHWPELSAAEIAGGAAAAVALSAVVLRALRARRRVPRPLEPENDTRVDAGDFTLAEPAAVLAARRSGGDDPHGIVLGERIAAEILRRPSRDGGRAGPPCGAGGHPGRTIRTCRPAPVHAEHPGGPAGPACPTTAPAGDGRPAQQHSVTANPSEPTRRD